MLHASNVGLNACKVSLDTQSSIMSSHSLPGKSVRNLEVERRSQEQFIVTRTMSPL